MAGLKDHTDGVDLGSPPELSDMSDDDSDFVEEVVEEVAAEADAESDAPEAKPEDREYNLQREFARKQDQFENRVMDRLDQMSTQTIQQPVNQGAKTVDDYSVSDLEAYRDGMEADDARRGKLDGLIQEKVIASQIATQVADITGRQAFKTAKTEAVQKMHQRYPDLKDDSTDFYRQVDQEVRVRGEAHVNSNPNALLDIANEVYIRMGSNRQSVNRNLIPGRPASKRDSQPAPSTKPEFTWTREDARKNSKGLEEAMGRPFTDEELDRIVENHQSYRDTFARMNAPVSSGATFKVRK